MSIPRKKSSKCRVRELYYIKGGQHGPKRTINKSKMHFQHQTEQKQPSIAPGEVARFSPEPSSISHQMNHHHTWTWQTTWNTVDEPRLHLMQVTRRSQPEQSPPGGSLKKNHNTLCLFWMMPSLIVCDGSQQGRQSGARNHNTLVVTSGFFIFTWGRRDGSEEFTPR